MIAHELGHIADGHVVLADAGYKPALGISLLSMVLGIAAIAAGAGEAGAGILAAGQQAAMGKFLAFTRVQESTADATGAKFLREAGISGKGMLHFFKKLANEEYRYGHRQHRSVCADPPAVGRAHQHAERDLKASPGWNNPPDPALEERFKRVKAKLDGYVAPYAATLNKYPESNKSIYARYARAYAWHKAGYPDKADAETQALIAAEPARPLFPGNPGPDPARGGAARTRSRRSRKRAELTRYSR